MDTHFIIILLKYTSIVYVVIYIRYCSQFKKKRRGGFINKWKLDYILHTMHDQEPVIIIITTQNTSENGYKTCSFQSHCKTSEQ